MAFSFVSPLRDLLARTDDDGLTLLRDRLGMHDRLEEKPAGSPAPIVVHDTGEKSRAVVYAPEIDGPAEAGEVVWLRVLSDGPDKPPRERAMLVVSRANRLSLLGLLISTSQPDADNPNWLSIGPGQWEPTGKHCWLRLDKLIEVPEYAARREGALFPERRFEHVAQRLRGRFGWV